MEESPLNLVSQILDMVKNNPSRCWTVKGRAYLIADITELAYRGKHITVIVYTLFQAHREDRRAQQHLKCGRFDEAVKCHQLAANYLEDAITVTSSPRALESLSLQREFHLRQLHIVE